MGTFINEAELAETVGVSRTPVREALLLLSAEGLVQLVPNRGAFVPPLSPNQVHQVLQARAVIESWAAGEALRNLKVPLASMQASLDRQAALPEDADPSEFIAADRDFHEALVIAGGNEVMTKMYETVRSRHVVIGLAGRPGRLPRVPGRRRRPLRPGRAGWPCAAGATGWPACCAPRRRTPGRR